MTRAFHKSEALQAVKALRDKAHATLAEAGWVSQRWEYNGHYCLSGGINVAATGAHFSQSWTGNSTDGKRMELDEETRYAVQALKRAVAAAALAVEHVCNNGLDEDGDECLFCEWASDDLDPALHNEYEFHRTVAVPEPAALFYGALNFVSSMTIYDMTAFYPLGAPPLPLATMPRPKYTTVRELRPRGTDHYDSFIVRWNDSACGNAQQALDLLLNLTDEALEEAVENEYPLCEPVRGLAAPSPSSLALAAGSK